MRIALALVAMLAVASAWESQAPFMPGMSDEEFAKNYLMQNVDIPSVAQKTTTDISNDLWETPIDWRSKQAGVVHAVRDQGRCGSCWAFAVSEAMTDRTFLETDGKYDKILSPQELVSCDTYASGCNGAATQTTYTWIKQHGVATEVCYPYVSGNTGRSGTCSKTCTGEGDIQDRVFCGDISSYTYDEAGMRKGIESGPISVSMKVYADFRTYKSGIYTPKSTQMLGGHAVKIVGYGVEAGQKYWIVANSWGEGFGMKGYFLYGLGDSAKFGYSAGHCKTMIKSVKKTAFLQ